MSMLPKIEPIARIVVCEDDEPTRELLRENLEADRFEVLPAPSAEEALRELRYGAPDLLLLDLSLPDASGLDLLREIREAGVAPSLDPALPVVVLSGSSSESARVRGLREGADDYLVKPFHYPELLQRLRNLLARRSEPRRGPLRIGDLQLDPARREVRVGERLVELANKEFELLRALAADPTRVFTKVDLLRDVWGFETLGRTRTLDSHASRLRRKLDPDHGRYVVNCWGVGYRLVEA
jgi:DNA-binding response OmpR family regulator